MKLYLIRHGQTQANIELEKFAWDNNCPLNNSGRQEVAETAQLLKSWKVRPTHLISSPLTRARETATIIGEQLGRKVQIDNQLHEVNAGTWNDKTCAAVYDYIESLPIPQRFTFVPPKGESWQAAGKRLATVALQYTDDQEVILVSHYNPLQCGTGCLLQTSFETWNGYDYANASISLLVYKDGQWKADFIAQSPSGYGMSEIKKKWA